MKQRVGRDQARKSPVPVGNRMDRQEVENERADEQDRVGGLVGDAFKIWRASR